MSSLNTSQYATTQYFESFIVPLYTVIMAFSIYFMTCDPNPEEQEDEQEDDEQKDEEQEEEDEEEQDEEQEEDEQEEEDEEQDEDEEEQDEEQEEEDDFGEFQEEIVKSQEIHEDDTMKIQKDILKRLSFLERLFRELATSEHRLNSAMLDAMVSLIMVSTAGCASSPASHHDKSVSNVALSLRQRLEWMEVCCKADGWAHSNRAAQQQLRAIQSLSKLADERERTWLAAVAYSPV